MVNAYINLDFEGIEDGTTIKMFYVKKGQFVADLTVWIDEDSPSKNFQIDGETS